MGYKGHPGWSDSDVGNVPDRDPLLPCEWCGREDRWEVIKDCDRWLKSNNPDIPMLCPSCRNLWMANHGDHYRIKCLECGSIEFGDPGDSVVSDKKWHREMHCPDANFEVTYD